ncbi:MAG: hypothetical protein P8010_03050 [Desulfosarcinaceae bacterium]
MVALVNSHSAPAPGIYLCQVNATSSCGACCGLYNLADNGRPALTMLLAQRTARFDDVPRDVGALDDFAQWAGRRAGPTPLDHFHHCPFLGLIGEKRSRVGCLLHPLAAGNRGVDLRGLSYYGSFTCRTYFCPASREMAGRHQRLLKQIFDHWYPYGLVVTEARLVRLLLTAVEARLGGPIDPIAVATTPKAAAAFAHLLSLKIDWPFRPEPLRTAARIHYLFKDKAHERPAFVSSLPRENEDPRYTAIFQELVSAFSGPHEERRAHRLLDAAIDKAAMALNPACLKPAVNEDPT